MSEILHLQGVSSDIFWSRLPPLLSTNKGGKMSMKLKIGCQIENLDNINEAASRHLHQPVGDHYQQICQWAFIKLCQWTPDVVFKERTVGSFSGFEHDGIVKGHSAMNQSCS